MIFQGIYLNKPYNKFTEWASNMKSRIFNVEENIRLMEANRIMNASGDNFFNNARRSFENSGLNSVEVDKLHKNDITTTILPLLITTNKNLSFIKQEGKPDEFFVGQIKKHFEGEGNSGIKMSAEDTKNMWNYYLISNYSDRYPYKKEMIRDTIEKCLNVVGQNKKMPKVLSDAFYIGTPPDDILKYVADNGKDSDFELRVKKLAQRKYQQEFGMRNVIYEMICNGWGNKSKILSNSIMWGSAAGVVGITSPIIIVGLIAGIGAYHCRPKNSEKTEQTLLDLITNTGNYKKTERRSFDEAEIEEACFNIVGRIYMTPPEKLTEDFLDYNSNLLNKIIGGNEEVIERVKVFKNIQDLDSIIFIDSNNLNKQQLSLLEKIDILNTLDTVEKHKTEIPQIVEELIEQNEISQEYAIIIRRFANHMDGLNERPLLNKSYDSNVQTVEGFFINIKKVIERNEGNCEGSAVLIDAVSKKIDELIKDHTYERGLKLNNDIFQKNSGNNTLYVGSLNKFSEKYKQLHKEEDIVVKLLGELGNIKPKQSSKIPLEIVRENIIKIRKDSISGQIKNCPNTLR